MTRRNPNGYYDEVVYEDVREGVLEIDAQGRVWKVKKWRGSAWGHPSVLVDCEAYRAEQQPIPKGYLQIQLQHRGGRHVGPKIASAHRIVWRHFKGPIPKDMAINHKNGVKYDNRPENLELLTHSENVLHSLYVLGNRSKMRYGIHRMFGNVNPTAKLTPAKVRNIRMHNKRSDTMRLAKKYGVSASTIRNVRKNLTWTHVE